MPASELPENVLLARLAGENAWEHHMRTAAFVAALFLLIPSVSPCTTPAVSPEIDPRASLGVVQQWIYNYRAKPDYVHVPAAVRVLFHAQTFKEPENAASISGSLLAQSAQIRPKSSL